MYAYLKKISNKIAENLLLSFIISLSTGTALFLIIIGFNNRDLSVFIEPPFLMGLFVVSGITMKIVAGLGISITFGTVSIFFFRLFSSKIKGSKKGVKLLKGFLLILASAVVAYGVYNILGAIFYKPPTLFDQLAKFFKELLRSLQAILTQTTFYLDILRFIEELASLIFGLWSLIIMVYLIPIIRGSYSPISKETTWEQIKGKFGKFKYCLWKGYKSRIRKDYGTVYATEYVCYKTDVEDIRDQLSGMLLFPFMLIFISFLPLMGIVFILWIRVFSLDEKPYTPLERILLLVALIGILIYGTLIFLFVNVNLIIPAFNFAYALGIFSSMAILSYIIIKS